MMLFGFCHIAIDFVFALEIVLKKGAGALKINEKDEK